MCSIHCGHPEQPLPRRRAKLQPAREGMKQLRLSPEWPHGRDYSPLELGRLGVGPVGLPFES